MESTMMLLMIALIAIVFTVVGLAAYVLFKYAIVFIIAGFTGKLIDKFKK